MVLGRSATACRNDRPRDLPPGEGGNDERSRLLNLNPKRLEARAPSRADRAERACALRHAIRPGKDSGPSA